MRVAIKINIILQKLYVEQGYDGKLSFRNSCFYLSCKSLHFYNGSGWIGEWFILPETCFPNDIHVWQCSESTWGIQGNDIVKEFNHSKS